VGNGWRCDLADLAAVLKSNGVTAALRLTDMLQVD